MIVKCVINDELFTFKVNRYTCTMRIGASNRLNRNQIWLITSLIYLFYCDTICHLLLYNVDFVLRGI